MAWRGQMCTGIDFLAFRRQKTYTHLRPTEHSLLSESVMGSGPPFLKSWKPVVTLLEPDFSGTPAYLEFLGSDFFVVAVRCSTLPGASVPPSAATSLRTAVGSDGSPLLEPESVPSR